MSLLHLEVTLKSAKRKSDDSVTVSFETMAEQSTEEFSFIDSFRKQNGHLVFKKDAIKGSEIPKADTDEQGLSPSQSLKKSLYAVWITKTKRSAIREDWDTYYANAMAGFKSAVDKAHPDNE